MTPTPVPGPVPEPVAGVRVPGRRVAGRREDERRHPLAGLFAPRSVAVVGASRDDQKLGHQVLRQSHRLGFAGTMYAVNPRFERGGEVVGAFCAPDLSSIPEPIDLAFVAVPGPGVADVVEQCAGAGVQVAVIAAAGFGERGGEHVAGDAALARLAASHGMRLLGPNGFGLFVGGLGLNLTGYEDIPSGSTALVTQSGNVAIALFRLSAHAGVGFSHCIGVGNQLDVDAGELLSWIAEHERCRTVALYLEGLPPGGGERLRSGLEACEATGTGVIALKAGASSSGRRAAATHTGALAGDDRLWDAVLRDAGAVRVASAEEMADVLASATAVPGQPGAAFVVTDGGGDAVMTVDELERAGIPLAELSSRTRSRLGAMLPVDAPRSQAANPVVLDTAGGLQDDPLLLARCVEAAALDAAVGTVVVAGTYGGYVSHRSAEMEVADRLLAVRSGGTAIVVHSAFALDRQQPLERLRAGGVPVYSTPDRLVRALAQTMQLRSPAGEPRRRAAGPPPRHTDLNRPGRPPSARAAGRLLPLDDVAPMLAEVGIALPPFALVSEEAALAAAAGRIGFPLCMKVDDPDVVHKSDVGAIRLGVGRTELVDVARDLWARFPASRLLLMPMLAPGVELIVGLSHDPVFGPFVLVGRGGVTAELDPDVVVVPSPVTCARARSAWLSLRCSPLLSGWRGAPGVDLPAVATLTARLSRIADAGRRLELELNPVIARPDGCAVADVRAFDPAPQS